MVWSHDLVVPAHHHCIGNHAQSARVRMVWIRASVAGIAVVYVGMTVGAYVVLRSMARRWRAGEEDLPSPYGPAVVESRR